SSYSAGTRSLRSRSTTTTGCACRICSASTRCPTASTPYLHHRSRSDQCESNLRPLAEHVGVVLGVTDWSKVVPDPGRPELSLPSECVSLLKCKFCLPRNRCFGLPSPKQEFWSLASRQQRSQFGTNTSFCGLFSRSLWS